MIVNHHGVSKSNFTTGTAINRPLSNFTVHGLVDTVEMFHVVDVHRSTSNDILNKCGRAGWMNDMPNKNSIE